MMKRYFIILYKINLFVLIDLYALIKKMINLIFLAKTITQNKCFHRDKLELNLNILQSSYVENIQVFGRIF